MRFGLFGGARTDPGAQASDSRIYTDYIDYIYEAETLGFHSVFLVVHLWNRLAIGLRYEHPV